MAISQSEILIKGLSPEWPPVISAKLILVALTPVIDEDSENARLAVLHSYGIVDTPPERQFDEIVRLVAHKCNTPAAALNLVEAGRCWFKAQLGLDVTEISRDQSFCSHAVRSSRIFLVPDARLDQRFNRLPLVVKGGFYFYAGAPLVTPEGHSIGTLCVLDRQPRELTPDQLVALQLLSSEAMDMINLRRLISKPAAVATLPPFARAGPSGDVRHLLVVDDDDAVRAFVCLATRKLGYEVLEAANGVEALNQIAKHPGRIGLVLTDLNMPVMDGIELIRALKKQKEPPAIAVMSGRFESYIRSVLQDEGVTTLLGKPFSRDELRLTLQHAQVPAH
jgi:CheY-like chemotaxis protein